MARDEEFARWAVTAVPGLFRRAVLLCGDVHLAEDLVQETLARLYVEWRRIDAADHPIAYAHTTLYHLFVSSRRRRSSTELPRAELPEEPAETTSDHDLRLDLAVALRSLSATERTVVVARYLDDMSVAEVAALCRRPQGWVRTTSHRALRRLRATPALTV